MKSCLLSAEEVDDKKAAIWGVVEKKRKWENVTTMGEIEGGKKISSKYIVAKIRGKQLPMDLAVAS
jgi:hypothetical protein